MISEELFKREKFNIIRPSTRSAAAAFPNAGEILSAGKINTQGFGKLAKGRHLGQLFISINGSDGFMTAYDNRCVGSVVLMVADLAEEPGNALIPQATPTRVLTGFDLCSVGQCKLSQ